MAHTLQYSCLENPPPLQRSLPGRSLQGCKELDTTEACAHRCKTFLACGSSAQRELRAKVAQLPSLQRPCQHQVCRNTDCLHCRSSGPIRVFSQASCGWRSENLFGRSFFIAPPVLVLRGLPCLGSFSVVPHSRHLEGPPTQLGSYSVYWYIRHLKGYHGWGPAL